MCEISLYVRDIIIKITIFILAKANYISIKTCLNFLRDMQNNLDITYLKILFISKRLCRKKPFRFLTLYLLYYFISSTRIVKQKNISFGINLTYSKVL